MKFKVYSFQRFIIRCSANVLVPLIYRVFESQPLELSLKNSSPRVIVSLTTFPARIGRIWIVIESILRQDIRPDKIILWLSNEQFKDVSSLPRKLRSMEKKGLEIRFCEEDLRSHKKYYYALQEYPNDTIITIDDDLLYSETLIGDLINLNRLYPNTICCSRALRIIANGKDILPYSQWEFLKDALGPSNQFFYTSGGGTLFPPKTLFHEVLNKEVFMKYCLFADDVWLNLMSQLEGTMVSKVKKKSVLLPVFNMNNVKLSTLNLDQNLNDKQISDVRNYFIEKYDKDAFSFYFHKFKKNNLTKEDLVPFENPLNQ